MPKRNWVKFYKDKQAPEQPSSFAEFIMSKNLKGNRLIDLGCGNGRDTKLLNKGYIAVGVDLNIEKTTSKEVALIKEIGRAHV